MLLCLCYGVSEKSILNELAEGPKSIEAIQAKFKIGTNCGSCVCHLKDLIDKTKTGAQEIVVGKEAEKEQ